VGPMAGLDVLKGRKIACAYRASIPGPSSPSLSNYANPASAVSHSQLYLGRWTVVILLPT